MLRSNKVSSEKHLPFLKRLKKGLGSDFDDHFKKSGTEKKKSRDLWETLGLVMKILGFFPFRYRKFRGKTQIVSCLKWLVVGFIFFAFQVIVILIFLISFFIKDRAQWSGLVAMVWVLTPSFILIQAISYQSIILYSRKQLLLFCTHVKFMSSMLQTKQTSKLTRFFLVLSLLYGLSVPGLSYISTCSITTQARSIKLPLATNSCMIVYNYAFSVWSERSHITYSFILFIQVVSIATASVSSLLVEQWIIALTRTIVAMFRKSIQRLNLLLQDDYRVEPDLFATWSDEYATVHTLAEDADKFLSPLLLVAVAVNPTTFCLQAFWVAKSSNYRMFNQWDSSVFPLAHLIISFLRIALLSMAGHTFMEEVNSLSKVLPVIAENQFLPESKFQIDLFTLREMATPITLTACQFLSFTRMLLTTVLGAVGTYLIILVQMSSDKVC